MNFSELEKLMSSRGVNTLADIARTLKTTPQAVSNWKSRDQIPHHIEAKINNQLSKNTNQPSKIYLTPPLEDETISLSDILLTMAEQLKVIVLTTFVFVFITFTYLQFIQQPLYVSHATLLIPENKAGSIDGIAGLVSQFGVNIPGEDKRDLSSPTLYPELIKSRTFLEQILYEKFYTQKYGKKLSLLSILNKGYEPTGSKKDIFEEKAIKKLKTEMLEFVPAKGLNTDFSIVRVTAFEPLLAKELAESVLGELEALNRYFKNKNVNEKIIFINSRIATVNETLENSEQLLREFNEKNRQISSPALELELQRLERDVLIQENVYLTLKQQLELSRIEEIQVASIVQILDKPRLALAPSNKRLFINVFMAMFLGLAFGTAIGILRAYFNKSNNRKKIRKIKNFLKKKTFSLFQDYRIAGIVTVLMLIALPLFFGHKSESAVFFGRYSIKFMILNTIYLFSFLSFSGLFIYLIRKKNRS